MLPPNLVEASSKAGLSVFKDRILKVLEAPSLDNARIAAVCLRTQSLSISP